MRLVRAVLAVAAAVALAGCGGSGGGGGAAAFQTTMQGTWVRCDVLGAASEKNVAVVSGSTATNTTTSHANANCAGAGTVTDSFTATLSIGSAVTLSLNGAQVTAYQVNLTSGGVVSYDLAYIDTAAEPDRLYVGDRSGANDGTTAALRPTTLHTTYAEKSASSGVGGNPGTFQSQLQGTWKRCEVLGSQSEATVVTIGASSFGSTTTDYANTTCAGTGTVLATSTGTYTIGSTVAVTLQGAQVTAYQIDSTRSGTRFYDIAYIDTAANPDRLYSGDGSGANNGSTAALRPTALDTVFYLERQ